MLKNILLIPFVVGFFTFSNPCSQRAAYQPERPAEGEAVFEVDVINPKYAETPRTYDVEGEFEESEIDFVTARYSGIIDEVFVNEGDAVVEADPIIAISSEELLDQVDIKRAKIKEFTARLNLAKAKLTTMPSPDTPVSSDDVTFLDEEPAMTPPTKIGEPAEQPKTLQELADTLEALVERYTTEADALDKVLLDLHHKSPVAGTIMEILFTKGNRVKDQDKLVSIARTNPMSVSFAVPQDVASFVDKTSRVRITLLDAPDVSADGTVYFVSPDLDPVNKSIELKAHVENSGDRIKGGQKARVKLATNKKDLALIVPESAVINHGSKKYIFAVYGNQARLLEVIAGAHMDGERVEVKGVDLNVDDYVVMNPPQGLKNDAFVKIAAVHEMGNATVPAEAPKTE